MLKRSLVQQRLFSASSCRHFINGKWVAGSDANPMKILNPATQEVVNLVPEASEVEFNSAVEGCSRAFNDWKKTPVLTRQRYMFDYLRLLKENHKKLAEIITRGSPILL